MTASWAAPDVPVIRGDATYACGLCGAPMRWGLGWRCADHCRRTVTPTIPRPKLLAKRACNRCPHTIKVPRHLEAAPCTECGRGIMLLVRWVSR